MGRLHEYRHFVDPRGALLCVLLDRAPRSVLVDYVEDYLGLLIARWTEDGLAWGLGTTRRLADNGIGVDGR